MNASKSNEINPKIYCLRYTDERGCDPKKCTALHLKKNSLLKMIHDIRGSLNRAIILNPFSQKELTATDREIILKNGLIVIDCSWKKLLELKTFNLKNSRKLPLLRAVNPVNYGKWEKLSSAEAVAAALYITKFDEHARLILSKFSWGQKFEEMNEF